jgi:hypothetical protein
MRLPRIIRFRGNATTFLELSRRFGIHHQTLADRWKRAGGPEDIPDEMLIPPAAGKPALIRMTLDGEQTSVSDLAQIAGVSVSTIYRLVQKIGPDLEMRHLLNRGGVQRKAVERIKTVVPPWDPNDRAPGWCERKYDFLRNAGNNG